jgi:hypothetical protein
MGNEGRVHAGFGRAGSHVLAASRTRRGTASTRRASDTGSHP